MKASRTVLVAVTRALGADGRRLINGWKNAGLPWSPGADRVAFSDDGLR
jgi:hypothetical protein